MNCFIRFSSKERNLKSEMKNINSVHESSHKMVWNCLEELSELTVVEYYAVGQCKLTVNISSGRQCTYIWYYLVVIQRVCLNSITDPCIGIKTKIETWKFLAKFMLKHESFKEMYNIKLDLAEMAMRALLREVRTNLIEVNEKVIKSCNTNRFCNRLRDFRTSSFSNLWYAPWSVSNKYRDLSFIEQILFKFSLLKIMGV